MLSECIVTGRGLIAIDSYTWTEIEIIHIMKVHRNQKLYYPTYRFDPYKIRQGQVWLKEQGTE